MLLYCIDADMAANDNKLSRTIRENVDANRMGEIDVT